MEEHSKKFDIYEYTEWHIKEGLLPNESDIQKLEQRHYCIYNHEVKGWFTKCFLANKNPAINLISYERYYDCDECQKVIEHINSIWNKWIARDQLIEMTYHRSYKLKDPQ